MSGGRGVFDGLRFVDFSTGIAGPLTAMHLADNGADVTRIESPNAAPEPRARPVDACGRAGCAAPCST